MDFKNIFVTYKVTFLFGFLGAIGGFLYWHYVGCHSGSCAITSSPINSTLYGSLMGGLLGNIFQSNNNHKKEIKNN